MTDEERIMEPPPPPPPASGHTNYGATEQPPAYEDCSPDNRGAPPSYESLYGRVKSVHQESRGICDFIWKITKWILSTIGCTILIGFVIAIPVSMIVMGALYLNDCPREHYIPIYLIVGGSFGLFKNLFDFCQRLKNQRDNNDENNAHTNPLDSLLNCFLAIWFIAGSIWIYRIYGDFDSVYDSTKPDRYCYGPLYYFAFWLTTATYLFMILFSCCFICCGCLAILLGQNNAGNTEAA